MTTTIQDKIDALNERIEAFTLNPDDYRDAYNEYCSDLDGDDCERLSPVLIHTEPMTFDDWMDTQKLEDDDDYKLLLEQLEKLEELLELEV